MPRPDGFLTTVEAAEALEVTPKTVRSMVADGRIRCTERSGRWTYVPRSEVDRLLEEGGYRRGGHPYGEGGDRSMVGRRFGRLVVEEFAGRNRRGDMTYRCRCDCGGEKVATKGTLLSGDATSCGSALRDSAAAKATGRNAVECVDGTQLHSLSGGPRSDNASGVRGVSRSSRTGLWEAYINFQGRKRRLGCYATLEEAAEARRAAEEETFAPVLERHASRLPGGPGMTTEEAAEAMGVPVSAVLRWLAVGKVSGEKVGRRWSIAPEEVARAAAAVASGGMPVSQGGWDRDKYGGKTMRELADEAGMTLRQLESRVYTLGKPLDEAMYGKRQVRVCRDHLGAEYPSVTAMCEAWGVARHVYWHRVKRKGWSIEKALTTPVGKRGRSKPCVDHLGNRYDSAKEMCDAWGVDQTTYSRRVKKGWTVEDALTKRRGK